MPLAPNPTRWPTPAAGPEATATCGLKWSPRSTSSIASTLATTALRRVVGPAGLPPAVLGKLNDTLVKALRSPALQAKLTDMGFDVVASSPDAYGKKIRQEIDLWTKIVRDNQIKAD